MSISENFKYKNQAFTKGFFKLIFLFALIIISFLVFDKGLKLIPEIKFVFFSYSKLFWIFIVLLIVVLLFNFSSYMLSLGSFEEETERTVIAQKVNVIIWVAYWFSWSVFCAWLTFNIPLPSIFITILTIVFFPGFIAFLISNYTRQQELKDNLKTKLEMEKSNVEIESYYLCLDKKYYGGYYGLVCLPVYLTFVPIFYFALK